MTAKGARRIERMGKSFIGSGENGTRSGSLRNVPLIIGATDPLARAIRPIEIIRYKGRG
jgi:hypothetical protein